MLNHSPNSCLPTILTSGRSRWFQAGRSFLTLLAVAAVGGLILYTSRANVMAADAKDAPARKAKVETLSASDLAQVIDQHIDAKLKENEVAASGRCSDGEFIRRVYLDIIGVIPPADRVRAFLNSNDPDKRVKLVDELLDNPRYGKYFGEIWTKDMVPQISNNRRLNNKPLQDWMTDRLNKNVHWDKLAYELITASGPQDKNGAVTFYIGNFGPDQVTNKVSKHFLGVQLQCAQCHDHPFTDWKQDEYWGMAAFFQKVGLNVNPNQAAKQGIQPTIKEYDPASLRTKRVRGKKPKQRIRVRLFRIPNEGKKLPPSYLLDKSDPSLNRAEPYRPVLAKWITSKNNRFFARAVSNRVWGHFFGRGLVNPINDMHDDNPSTHPELLQALTAQMKANDFDLKYMIRAITRSETYQRTSRPKGNNADERELFSHALVRQMSPEQLFDSLDSILKRDVKNNPRNKRRKVPANRRYRNSPRDQFIGFFSGDDGYKPLEYQAGIPQALRLMNSAQISSNFGAVVKIMNGEKAPAKVIENLFLTTVARPPTSAETQRLTQYVQKQDNARAAYGDILWALVNSSEFALNH